MFILQSMVSENGLAHEYQFFYAQPRVPKTLWSKLNQNIAKRNENNKYSFPA